MLNIYIYKLYNKEKELLYVGKTTHIHIRIRQHILDKRKVEWKKNISYIEYAKCLNETDMNIYEVYYINKLSPKHNVSENYNTESSINIRDLTFQEYKNKDDCLKLEDVYDADLGKLFRLYLNFISRIVKVGYLYRKEHKTYQIVDFDEGGTIK